MPETTGNGYAANDAEILPYDLAAATEKLAQSEIAHEILGDSFVIKILRKGCVIFPKGRLFTRSKRREETAIRKC